MVRLSCLRRLDEIEIDVDNEATFSLKHLKNFNQLSGSLELVWFKRVDGDVEDAKQANLHHKKHITHFLLNFRGGDQGMGMREKKDDELVEALNIPPNLEFLKVKNYTGIRAPSWLDSLIFVRRMELTYWWNLEHLPNSLAKLPCLEHLELFDFFEVRKVGAEFLGMNEMMLSSSPTTVPLFPKLKSLEFAYFTGWEEWNDVDAVEEMLIMPSLTFLKLSLCKKLKALPNFILRKTSLECHIAYCDALQQSTSSVSGSS